MGCVSSNEVSNPNKKNKGKKQNTKQIQPALYRSKLDKSYASKIVISKHEQLPQVQKADNLPKIRKTTSTQFLNQYEISSTLIQSTRMQGPKLLTNKITGGVNVLRVYAADKVDEERLKRFHEIMRFELYTDEEENYLLLDRYCSGVSIVDLFSNMTDQEEQRLTSEDRKSKQLQIYKMLLQVYDIISNFHQNHLYLGNLTLFSFKKVSDFDEQIKLVEFNFQTNQHHNSNNHDSHQMGHAHKNSFQADWQFFGYLIQFYLSSKSPVFIPHKMQYIQNDSSNPYVGLISALLKGRQVTRKQVQQIQPQRLKLRNQNVLMGYRFCNDVLRLIKARKRRTKHKIVYYSQQILSFYQERNRKEEDNDPQNDLWRLGNLYNLQQHLKLTEQNLHRFETDRILNTIESYIERLNAQCEEHFVNYSMAAENFRKLKEVFLIAGKKQQFDQFKELIPQIK